jgi:hypothetical protein
MKLNKTVVAVGIALICLYGNMILAFNSKFQVGDLVYVCNENVISDGTPLCITNYSSKVINIRKVNRTVNIIGIRVYAEDIEGIDPVTIFVDEKYVHFWTDEPKVVIEKHL